MDLLVVTGMSGAGKSTALRALEDLGYYCVDNLPVPLITGLLDALPRMATYQGVAVGIDSRAAQNFTALVDSVKGLEEKGHKIDVLYLEAPQEVLVRRFSETRRRHPLGALPDAIAWERERLVTLRNRATTTIDTEKMSARDLRRTIRDRYIRGDAMNLVLTSFGFKFGLPSQADLVFDLRFLHNPFDVPELRPLRGTDEPVAKFVMEQEEAEVMLEKIGDLICFQVPLSVREGRFSLTVAIGCTGGQHRSVAMVEALGRRLRESPTLEKHRFGLAIRHRDVNR